MLVFSAAQLMADESYDYSTSKEYHQSFAADANDELDSRGIYGDASVSYWNRNEVDIRVVIECQANRKEYLSKVLEKIIVNMGKEDNVIHVYTSTGPISFPHGINFDVNIYIKKPVWMLAKIRQRYGDVYMPESNSGKNIIDVAYGELKAGDFPGEPLSVVLQYGNLEIGNFKRATLDLSYCGNINIGNGSVLSLTNKYSSDTNIGSVHDIIVSSGYDDMNIESVTNLTMNNRYGKCNIRRLVSSAKCKMSYTDFNIRSLDSDFRTVELSNNYGGIDISIDSRASFTVSASNIRYGDCDIKYLKTTQSRRTDDSYYGEINNGRGGSITLNSNGYTDMSVRGR